MEFDAKRETQNIIDFIQEYYYKNNVDGAIIGISGGKDSAVVAALMTKAIGKENVIGVTMPCHTVESARSDAELISNYYGFKLINFDLTDIYESFKDELKHLGNFTEEETKNSDINIKPRLRMLTLYYLGALYSKLKGKTYLVIGTSNKSELYVGYFTKGGDSVHDLAPIADLTVSEVIKIGEYLKVPEKVLYKTPSDDLSDQTDEEKLGVKYSDIETVMKEEETGMKSFIISDDVRKKVKRLHQNNLHKFTIPTYRK